MIGVQINTYSHLLVVYLFRVCLEPLEQLLKFKILILGNVTSSKNIYRNVLRISMNTIKQNSFQNDYLFEVLCCRKGLQIMACVYIYSERYNNVNSSYRCR